MHTKDIEHIELKLLDLADYEELKETKASAYSSMSDAYWREEQIKTLLEKFPTGQVVIKINGQLAGCALSLIVSSDFLEEAHDYLEITGNYSFDTHDEDGDILYGIDVFIKQILEGLG